ncbi:MAG: LLM class flavin-dependent oxidoreductase [Gammaproteobacteria bacterium]|nr:LLM class flavin-dependent oxidoreductase [Gammaproteobacteria bacterium]
MGIRKRIAVTLPVPPGIEASLERARWAEDNGFDDVWFADSAGPDALTLAATIGAITKRVRIGTAIIPVFTRTPAVFAATAYALNHVTQGRFILGLGSSSQTMMKDWNGLEFEKPLTRVKETAILVRQMLTGERTDFDGTTLRSHGYRQAPLDPGAVPIYLAGLRPKMLALAGEIGDGVILNLFPTSALPKIVEAIDEGARRVGKRASDREVVCRHQVIVTDDKPAAREAFRRAFAPYYATPVYNQFLAWCGFEEVADAISAGWAERDRAKTTGAMSDELVDEIAIIGTREECQERIRGLAAGGVDTHIIASPIIDLPVLDATFEAFSAAHFSF